MRPVLIPTRIPEEPHLIGFVQELRSPLQVRCLERLDRGLHVQRMQPIVERAGRALGSFLFVHGCVHS